MLKNEILLIKAKIAEKKEKLKKLFIRADNHIITIRSTVDPLMYDKDFTEIPLERAKLAMDDLYEIWCEAKELKEQIKKLEGELNG